jgi:hypothetical protein
VGLEHHVEFADRGEIALAANRADHLMSGDELVHVSKVILSTSTSGYWALDEIIGAMARFAGFAVDHRIVESGDVARSFPDFRIHENRGVKADVGRRFLNEFLPPHRTDVAFHLGAKGAVIPRIRKTAVNGRSLIDETNRLKMLSDFLEAEFFGHDLLSSFV